MLASYQSLLIALAAVLWGSATVVSRALLKDLPPDLVTALRFAVALPFLFVLWFSSVAGGEISILTGQQVIYLLLIMLGPGFGAMYLYYKGWLLPKLRQRRC